MKVGPAIESRVRGSGRRTVKTDPETRVSQEQEEPKKAEANSFGQIQKYVYNTENKRRSKRAILGRAAEDSSTAQDTGLATRTDCAQRASDPCAPLRAAPAQRQGRRRRRDADGDGSDDGEHRRRPRRRRAARQEGSDDDDDDDDERARALVPPGQSEGQLEDDDVGLSHADAQEQTFAAHVPPACARPPLLAHPDELVETASLASVVTTSVRRLR